MWLIISVFSLFFLLVALSYIEDLLTNKVKSVIYIVFGALLVLMAACREIGFDPDSETYETYFKNYDNILLLTAVEYSYLWLCELVRNFSADVHWVFLIYATLGVSLKLIAFRKFGSAILTYLLIYVCYYFELHETTQMRAGVMSGFFLLCIYFTANSKRLYAFFCIIFGSIFHLSAIAMIPILFLNNKPLTRNWKRILAFLIPAAFVFAVSFSFMSLYSEIPYLGTKLASYQEQTESGQVAIGNVPLFGIPHLISVCIFYYLLYFSDSVAKNSKYFPILMRIFALGIFMYIALNSLPVLAERMSSLYKIVSIFLIAEIANTIRPRWAGVSIVVLIAFIFLNFILRSMYNFTIFLKPV